MFDGRSVVATPDGLVLIAGTFTGTLNDAGYDVILSGHGQRTAICPLIAEP